ncbi:uncharacterized protein K441DRAFT_653196 [Cenococcum geophilum 1.58]|uniref:uncharacterized protein n=1 Tax=Cenococcum geophilum 1.58 TaxID=794803 RepID=UPI00358E375D|nr:hypothetical protein K441DRAFT_653196 [Cenococcum geophilum 1.58]
MCADARPDSLAHISPPSVTPTFLELSSTSACCHRAITTLALSCLCASLIRSTSAPTSKSTRHPSTRFAALLPFASLVLHFHLTAFPPRCLCYSASK